MKNFKKITALLLVLVMCVGMFAACGGKDGDDDKTLAVGYAPFNSKFSPFFSETAYDQDVAGMTGLGLLTSDRTGAIVYKGKTGETIAYNGTNYTYNGPADLTVTTDAETGKVYYDFVLRDDIKFSDGQKLTADDVIFTMYVLSDPTYDGSSTFFALPIEGMKEYRSGMSAKWMLILNDGEAASKLGSASGYYTAAEAEAFWTAFFAAGAKFAQEIVDYCLANYASYGAVDVATSAALWGYGDLAADATAADFFAAIYANFGNDISDSGINYESAGSSFQSLLVAELSDTFLAGVQTGESAPSITGIQKTGEYSLRVVLTEVDAVAIYQLAITIAPSHYYGDGNVDVNNNKFGFPKGDLSLVRAKTTKPMGAGPYKFVKFENGVVNFEANENYFLGKPKTKYVNFVECLTDDDKLNGIIAGTIDISDPSFDKDTVNAIKQANGNDQLNGAKLNINTVNNLGYGYLGMSANALNINGDPGSEASKNLRRAFATIFSVYRDVSVDTYYGEQASVINYPISDTSWAAPRPSDAGYEVAFSKDVNGNPIYTSGMTADQKYAAAKTAALGFFAAAGFTVENGRVTAAPAGAPASYELWIPADGKGDHPSFMMATMGTAALVELGINITVKDLADSSLLWDAIEADTCQMWTAAWGATVDPDMYQIYYSGVESGLEAGGSNYMYDIADAELDELIMAARKTLDQSARKLMYKECLDIVIDWAVEVPVYQRQNAIAFSAERVNMATVTPDITTFYGWMAEIHTLEMK